jgi:hypothetical protein
MSGATSTSTSTTTTTTSTSSPGPPTPAPAKLTSHEAYTANIKTTYGTQRDALANVQRLTPMPANSSPELVYLGVLKGGKKAVFLITSNVAVTLAASASATCLPGPNDCQVIELVPGDTVKLAPASGQPGVAKFSLTLTALGVTKKSSSADATATRKNSSVAGQQVVAASSSTALADFFYDLALGSLVYHHQPSGSGPTGATGSTGSSGAT